MSFRYINNLVTSEKLNKFLALLDLAAGSGDDPLNAYKLGQKLHNSNPMKICLQALEEDPTCRSLIKERYIGPSHKLEDLVKMPKDSLGWTYGTILTAMGYDLLPIPVPELFETDADYISFRVFNTHDIHHILTGYSLDNMGELGVLSVTVAQIGYPGFIFLDLVSMLMNFFTNDQLYNKDLEPEKQVKTLSYAFKLISAGIEMGSAANLLFPVKWEEIMEQSLSELRNTYHLNPVTEGIYSWYSNPVIKSALGLVKIEVP